MPYDYTAGDRINADQDNIDDFELADVTAPDDRDADKIQADNGWRTIPPGRHILMVQGFRDRPELGTYSVLLDGRTTGFDSYRVKVKLCLPHDPRATVEDNFLLPPENPRELSAYYNGVPADKPGGNPGFQANKFIHFIDRLGFPFPAGGKLPPAGRRIGNWKGRLIVGEIIPGKSYIGNDGKEREGFPQVKLFSYDFPPADGQPLPPVAQKTAAGRPAMAQARPAAGLDQI